VVFGVASVIVVKAAAVNTSVGDATVGAAVALDADLRGAAMIMDTGLGHPRVGAEVSINACWSQRRIDAAASISVAVISFA